MDISGPGYIPPSDLEAFAEESEEAKVPYLSGSADLTDALTEAEWQEKSPVKTKNSGQPNCPEFFHAERETQSNISLSLSKKPLRFSKFLSLES